MKNPNLNLMRFVAALFVLVSHARTMLIQDYSQVHDSSAIEQVCYLALSLGHQAVIVFFVLSGYWVGGSVITKVKRNDFSFIDYLIARFSRLWMVLLPALLLTLILDLMGLSLNGLSDIYAGSPGYHTTTPTNGVAPNLSLEFFLGNATFFQGLLVPPLGTNTPLWSIASEFWYYMVFPVFWMAIFSPLTRWRRGVCLAVSLLMVLFLFLLDTPRSVQTLALFPTWLLGAAVGAHASKLNFLRYPRHGFCRLLLDSFLVGNILLAAILDQHSPNWFTPYLLSIATSVAIIVWGQKEVSGITIVSAKLSRAAEWSYSLYAVHMPILALLASFMVPTISDRLGLYPGVFALLASSILCCLFAYGMFLLFERNTGRVRSYFLTRVHRQRFDN